MDNYNKVPKISFTNILDISSSVDFDIMFENDIESELNRRIDASSLRISMNPTLIKIEGWEKEIEGCKRIDYIWNNKVNRRGGFGIVQPYMGGVHLEIRKYRRCTNNFSIYFELETIENWSDYDIAMYIENCMYDGFKKMLISQD